MNPVREQIIETTSALLEAQGYHATGLNQILAESGAPKGSLYYYFPEGKEELTAEAIDRAGRIVSERIKNELSGNQDASELIPAFIRTVAFHVEDSGYHTGGPLMIVAMETAISSERLNKVCREAYGSLQQAFQEKLLASGYAGTKASQLATFITASIEGGIILSRTNHNADALRLVADVLAPLLKSVSSE